MVRVWEGKGVWRWGCVVGGEGVWWRVRQREDMWRWGCVKERVSRGEDVWRRDYMVVWRGECRSNSLHPLQFELLQCLLVLFFLGQLLSCLLSSSLFSSSSPSSHSSHSSSSSSSWCCWFVCLTNLWSNNVPQKIAQLVKCVCISVCVCISLCVYA